MSYVVCRITKVEHSEGNWRKSVVMHTLRFEGSAITFKSEKS